jgi:glyoxylase-like metal-dependent hydrolase (beta-lactamase superfamily II)
MMEEIRPGLKRWAGPHPEFDPAEGDLDESYTDVASALFHGEDAFVLFDPLVPDELWPELDAEVNQSGKPVVVLTTIFFHERNRADVARRYGARLGGDVAGVREFSAERGNERGTEVAYWLEQPRAVVFGDAVLGDQAGGLRLTPWSRSPEGLERTRRALLALLDLPVEVVLPAHGNPVRENGHDALARALHA